MAIVSQDSIVLVLLFDGVPHKYRPICSKMGYRIDALCEAQCQGGGIAPFWRTANLPEQVSRDMGYTSDSIKNIARYGATKHRSRSSEI